MNGTPTTSHDHLRPIVRSSTTHWPYRIAEWICRIRVNAFHACNGPPKIIRNDSEWKMAYPCPSSNMKQNKTKWMRNLVPFSDHPNEWINCEMKFFNYLNCYCISIGKLTRGTGSLGCLAKKSPALIFRIKYACRLDTNEGRWRETQPFWTIARQHLYSVP